MGKLVKDMTPEERERRRAYDAAYRAAHSEERRAYRAAYDAAHSEERRAYYAAYDAAHSEERRAYRAAYRADKRTHRTNARMARLGFAFADPNAIVAAIGKSVRKNSDTQTTKAKGR